MSRAEERALEEYDTNTPAPIRIAYRDGYEQAEKDLALTWEDMQRIWQIIDIANEECNEHQPSWMYGSKSFFSEVLRRFEETRK